MKLIYTLGLICFISFSGWGYLKHVNSEELLGCKWEIPLDMRKVNDGLYSNLDYAAMWKWLKFREIKFELQGVSSFSKAELVHEMNNNGLIYRYFKTEYFIVEIVSDESGGQVIATGNWLIDPYYSCVAQRS